MKDSESKKARSKKGKAAALVCHILGTIILIVVIGALLPITVPKFMGYHIYNIVSGSMEPALPGGSVVYVKEVEPSSVEEGDIIAFMRGEGVVTHRVTENRQIEGYFLTKGDANDEPDLTEVRYAELIGKVVRDIPVLGDLMIILTGMTGKLLLLCLAICGVLLNILGGRF